MKLVLGKRAMAQNAQKRPGLIWADRAALIVAIALSALVSFCWLIAFIAIGSLGGKHLWQSMGIPGIELIALIAGLVLVVMRGVDFVRGGPTYSLFMTKKSHLNSSPITAKPAHT